MEKTEEIHGTNCISHESLIPENLEFYQLQKIPWLPSEQATQRPSDLPFPGPALPEGCAGSTVAPPKALSRWLCCFASCSKVSSSRIRWSRSYCSDFCHFLLWVWANIRKSLQACRGKELISITQLVRDTSHALSTHSGNFTGRLQRDFPCYSPVAGTASSMRQ